MSKALIQIDYDTMENHHSLSHTTLCIFTDEVDGLSAHGKADDYLRSTTRVKPIMHYMGNDGEIYPQFRLRKVEVR